MDALASLTSNLVQSLNMRLDAVFLNVDAKLDGLGAVMVVYHHLRTAEHDATHYGRQDVTAHRWIEIEDGLHTLSQVYSSG